MDEQRCKCGCDEILPETNKSGWKWGHKGKAATALSPAENQTAPQPEAKPEIDHSRVSVALNEFQIERIWAMLPLPEKALAITEALLADRS